MIELKEVSKMLKKNKVLDNVTYCFESGKIYGLYGENGSGKTMLLRGISGLIIPTEGEIFYNGQKLHKDIAFPNNTGIVIENMELLPKFTAKENLRLLAGIRRMASEEEIDQALNDVGLDPTSKKKVKKFSLGMKQRLNIAQAIFERQEVILLDEPTNGLDENAIALVYDLIQKQKARGATVIIATHHKQDLESMCDIVLKMSNGKLITEGAV